MMTEDQKRALSNWLPGRISHLNDKESTQEGGLTAGQFFQRASYQIALAALTQPASPALRLPDKASMADFYENVPGGNRSEPDEAGISMWNACIDEVKRLNAPHTAPIEPICATGGAEWVKVSERMPGSNQTVQFYVADDKAIKQGRFISGSWHQEQDWCESSYGGMIDSEVCGNITHWMPLPAAPIS